MIIIQRLGTKLTEKLEKDKLILRGRSMVFNLSQHFLCYISSISVSNPLQFMKLL